MPALISALSIGQVMMTAAGISDQVIDRDRLAAALRQVARGMPGEDRARQAAESVIAHSVTDHPGRKSDWSGDGQERLTEDQALRAVRAFAVAVVPQCDEHSGRAAGREPGCRDCAESSAVWARVHREVVTTYERGPVTSSPEQDTGGDAPAAGYRPRCAHCGEPYTPRTRQSRYCSPACRQAAYRGRKAQGAA